MCGAIENLRWQECGTPGMLHSCEDTTSNKEESFSRPPVVRRAEQWRGLGRYAALLHVSSDEPVHDGHDTVSAQSLLAERANASRARMLDTASSGGHGTDWPDRTAAAKDSTIRRY